MNLHDFQHDVLGYTFASIALLSEALTTPAHAKQHGGASYERLEFLGDAVLKIAMAEALFDQQGKGPDQMTRERNILESNKVLATQAVELGLHHVAISLSPVTVADIGILADIFEALAGAIYLDSGKNLNVVKRVLVDRIIAHMNAYIDASPDHFKNMFLEAVQKVHGFTPVIKIGFDENGPDHDKRFTARGMQVINPKSDEIVLDFPSLTTRDGFKQKRDAEKALMKLAFEAWRDRDFAP